MEILKKNETSKLKFRARGSGRFSTPIRDAFDKLKVGESLVITNKEWNEYYKGIPHASVGGWSIVSGKKHSIRTLSKDRTKKGYICTWAIIRKT